MLSITETEHSCYFQCWLTVNLEARLEVATINTLAVLFKGAGWPKSTAKSTGRMHLQSVRLL